MTGLETTGIVLAGVLGWLVVGYRYVARPQIAKWWVIGRRRYDDDTIRSDIRWKVAFTTITGPIGVVVLVIFVAFNVAIDAHDPQGEARRERETREAIAELERSNGMAVPGE